MRHILSTLLVLACLLAVGAATAMADGPPDGVASPSTPAFSEAELARLKTLARAPSADTEASRPLSLYGYIKFDMAWDAHATNEGNFARWVDPEGARRNDDQFNATVRETRLGLDIAGPSVLGATTTGKLEVDFYGGGTENNVQLKLRHAYVKLAWSESRFSLLAGQTWDVCHPLHMPTINYTVGWWAGNIGFRRPQLRLTQGLRVGRRSEAQLELAVARTITGRNTPFTPTFVDTGEDAGFPTLQGRLEVGTTLRSGREVRLGFSGHWAQEEHHLAAGGATRDFDSWSAGLDASLALGSALQLTGEAWAGSNLDAYLGGVGQGLNLAVAGMERAIDSRGGWLALRYTVSPCLTLAAGAGVDDPQDGDLAAGMRSFNATGFVNAWLRWQERLGVGLEVSYWLTEYVARRHGNSLRVQFAIKYEF